MSPTAALPTWPALGPRVVLDAGAGLGTDEYRGLLFVATFLAAGGFLLANHGGAAYALLLWLGGAGVLTWLYVEPVLGAFFFVAATFEFTLAAHLWGDPLGLWPRTRRLAGRIRRVLLGTTEWG